MTWETSIFTPLSIPVGTLTEYSLMTEAELATRSLGRGTVGMMYGRIQLGLLEGETQLDQAAGAWGIRLKEADAPAVLGTTFSPIVDAESSEWMHWRGYSLLKTGGAGTAGSGDPQQWVDENFVVRNPRKIDTEEELVMLFENPAGSTAAVNVQFWIRVLLILP